LRERIRGICAIQGEDLIRWNGCQSSENRHGGGKLLNRDCARRNVR
jgi:hypothetical protein